MGADADVVRRLTEDVFIGGNVGAIDELMADDFVSHDPPPGMAGTREGFRSTADTVIRAFADRKMEFDEYIETTDGRIVQSWAMTAIHKNEAFEMPASGQAVRVRGVEIFRCSGGKVAEHWGAIDISDVMGKAMGGS